MTHTQPLRRQPRNKNRHNGSSNGSTAWHIVFALVLLSHTVSLFAQTTATRTRQPSTRQAIGYLDEYREMVTTAVDLAFSISHRKPQTLRFETDADQALPADNKHVMLRNHGEYSPVYAMAIIARVWDINTVYRAAELPDVYTCFNKPENFDALFEWTTLKIEPNSAGGGYVFRSDACERHDGEI